MKIEAFKLVCGSEVVRSDGHGMFWLGGDKGHPMSKMPGNAFSQQTRARCVDMAEQQIGKHCEWLLDGETESIPVM